MDRYSVRGPEENGYFSVYRASEADAVSESGGLETSLWNDGSEWSDGGWTNGSDWENSDWTNNSYDND